MCTRLTIEAVWIWLLLCLSPLFSRHWSKFLAEPPPKSILKREIALILFREESLNSIYTRIWQTCTRCVIKKGKKACSANINHIGRMWWLGLPLASFPGPWRWRRRKGLVSAIRACTWLSPIWARVCVGLGENNISLSYGFIAYVVCLLQLEQHAYLCARITCLWSMPAVCAGLIL